MASSIWRGYEPTWQGSFNLPFIDSGEDIGISEVLPKDGTPVYLVANEGCFGRPAVYGEADNLECFLLFSLIVSVVSKSSRNRKEPK